jgi:hypothetical protein
VEQVALAIKRTTYSVHGYEAGTNWPPVQVLIALARLYGSGLDDLTDDAAKVPA